MGLERQDRKPRMTQNQDKTNEVLTREILDLRRQVALLQAADTGHRLSEAIDVGLPVEIAGLFLEEYGSFLAAIRKAIANRDVEALEFTAHTLKGAVASFGSRSSFAAAEKLEMMGRDGQLDGALEACEELTSHIERLTPALAAFLKENAACIA